MCGPGFPLEGSFDIASFSVCCSFPGPFRDGGGRKVFQPSQLVRVRDLFGLLIVSSVAPASERPHEKEASTLDAGLLGHKGEILEKPVSSQVVCCLLVSPSPFNGDLFLSQTRILPYTQLQQELGVSNLRELEDLIIEGANNNVMTGKLDQRARHFEVDYTMARDLKKVVLSGVSAGVGANSFTLFQSNKLLQPTVKA